MDGARWYNPATATFTTRDTYPGAVGANTTLNRYTYGLNNPLSYNDPTGHSSEPVCDNACLWAQYQNTGDIGTDHTYYENEDGSFNSGVHVTVGDNGEILVTAPTDVVLSTASQTSRSQSLSYTPNEATPQAVEMLISVNMSVDEIARGINGPLDGIRTDPLTSGANELVNSNTGSTYVSDLFVMLQNSSGRRERTGSPQSQAGVGVSGLCGEVAVGVMYASSLNVCWLHDSHGKSLWTTSWGFGMGLEAGAGVQAVYSNATHVQDLLGWAACGDIGLGPVSVSGCVWDKGNGTNYYLVTAGVYGSGFTLGGSGQAVRTYELPSWLTSIPRKAFEAAGYRTDTPSSEGGGSW